MDCDRRWLLWDYCWCLKKLIFRCGYRSMGLINSNSTVRRVSIVRSPSLQVTFSFWPEMSWISLVAYCLARNKFQHKKKLGFHSSNFQHWGWKIVEWSRISLLFCKHLCRRSHEREKNLIMLDATLKLRKWYQFADVKSVWIWIIIKCDIWPLFKRITYNSKQIIERTIVIVPKLQLALV